ncbi:MAG: YhdP family protein [Burkholderiaceae bacterium]
MAQLPENRPLSRLAAWGGALAAGYRHLGRWARRLLGGLFRLAVVLYFLFCGLFLTLRYAVLPNVDHYKADIERVASRALGQPVSIGAARASWHGLRPHLALSDVVVHDDRGRAALTLPAVEGTVSWWSAAVADLRLNDLEIISPDLDIRRDRDGRLHVGGIFIDPAAKSGGAGADWVLSQREIVIRGGRLRWNDEQRAAPELVLENVNFVLHNRWRRHRFALQATPAAALAAPLDIRADFTHAPFSSAIADPARWNGELYLHLRDADFAAWKPYLDMPFELSRGGGSVRAWLQFQHANVADFTVDLGLRGVSARFGAGLEPLELTRVDGRVSVSEVYEPARKLEWLALGRRGHTVALQDLALETDDGLRVPPTTLRESYAAATKNQPARTRIEARELDLGTLAALAQRLPLSELQRGLLQDYAPRGRLLDFSAQWRGPWPEFSSYAVKGRFAGLGIGSRPAASGQGRVPGFANLDGSIDASDKGGTLKLDAPQASLLLPGILREPELPFEQLRLQARWQLPDRDTLVVQLDQLDLRREDLQASLSGKHVLPLHRPQELGSIDLNGRIARFDLARIGRYLPAATPEHLRHWLSGALRHGRATDVALAVKGDLARFPFHVERPGDKPAGEFRVTGKIEDGTLEYSPGEVGRDGKGPEWPLLERIDGSFVFERSRMEIRARSAMSANVAIGPTSAVIPDLLAPEPVLDIDGSAAGALPDFVGFVNRSPVLGWIGDFTEETKASGNARLALKLQLPLEHMDEAKVEGTLHLAGNDVTLMEELPPIRRAAGKLEFNEHGFNLNGVKGEFLDGPVALSGGSRTDGSILVRADGTLAADGLRKTYDTPALRRPLQRISGSTRYGVTIAVREQRPEITVESDLAGLGLDFPAPLKKGPGEPLPLKFRLAGVASDDVLVARDEIRLALGSAIEARYQRRRGTDRREAWRVVAGGIGVNVPAPEPQAGLAANVNVATLNIDAWRSIGASMTAAADQQAEQAADGFDLAQYIEPEVLAARADELIVLGKKLDNVVVGASHQGRLWQANIDSAQASGYVTWNESRSGRTLGRVKARLASLVVPESAASDVGDLLEGEGEATQIPALDIVAESFQLFGKQFGRLEVQASNIRPEPGSEVREWRIGKLELANPDATFKGVGKWTTSAGKSVSNLTYALDVNDAGKLLERVGFAQVLRGGKGRMDGEITWNGLPFSLDIPTLTGQLHLDMQAGQFLKVDPGAAKLLGVLSLQSLPRRLALDFRDVFSEGFAFDGVVATAMIANGRVTTDNFKMRSVAATVLMDGSADLTQETQNLHVAVIPEINLGTASVVAGLINPVVGVGSFLAQLFLRDPLIRAFTFEYDISGPWKDPKVVKLERKGTPLPEPAAAEP